MKQNEKTREKNGPDAIGTRLVAVTECTLVSESVTFSAEKK